MTSYMYNPTRKITEILSTYLEFDPEQLKLGIWSGHLSLTDVSLREEALYPLLNAHVKTTSSSHSKPPLRFKLVSGKIGSLELTIPWKRLVWGQGDVQVNIKGVTIVLALESIEETEQRRKDNTKNENDSNVDGDESNIPETNTTVLFPDMIVDDGDLLSSTSQSSKAHAEFMRDLKQNRLNEAERRHMRGLPIGSWLRTVNKRDRHAVGKMMAASKNEELAEASNRFESWLKGATKDFFWRFHSGLALNIENVKIIVIQDGVELGLMLPLTQMVAGGSNSQPTTPKARGNNIRLRDDQAIENVVYQGEYDDGEHVDKCIKVTGLGVYVRSSTAFSQNTRLRGEGDPSTKEFVLRPVDLSFAYSIFYPYPPEKRKAKETFVAKHSRDDTTTAASTINSNEMTPSVDSTKRRRGKRDKASFVDSGDITASERLGALMPLESLHSGNSYGDGATSAETPSALSIRGSQTRMNSFRRPRQSSLIQPSLGRATSGDLSFDDVVFASGGSFRRKTMTNRLQGARLKDAHKPDRQERIDTPLIHAQDLGEAFATAQDVSQLLSPRLSSTVSVGAIEVVCSSSHFALLSALQPSSAKRRNGRPSMSIAEVLRGLNSVIVHEKRSQATGGLPNDSDTSITAESILEDDNGAQFRQLVTTEGAVDLKRRVVRSWWKYALRAVVWELRQRQCLRRDFQRMFLTFDWKKQRYRRREYIRLFIYVHLDKKIGWKDSRKEIELLTIEDELCIEQILLYRALARDLYVRGDTEMPDSLLSIRDIDEIELTSCRRRRSKGKSGGRSGTESSDGSSFISYISKQSITARRRFNCEPDNTLPRYSSFAPSCMGSRAASLLDEVTHTQSVDARPTGNATRRALFEPQIISGASSVALQISFSFNIEKLELLVVDEDDPLLTSNVNATANLIDEGDLASEDSQTEVSVLTDDQRFFREGCEKPIINYDESVDEGPILASTDFLLFRVPENILLRLIVTPLAFSFRSCGSESRNFNLKVGLVEAVGCDDVCLCTIGRSYEGRRDRPLDSDAMSLSVILNGPSSILQCDTAKLAVGAHMNSMMRIRSFFKTPLLFPRRMVESNQSEMARMCVKQQNAIIPFTAVSCSVRVHGIEVMFPFEQQVSISSDKNDSFGKGVKDGIVFRSGMIEAYSGAAISALTSAVDSRDTREFSTSTGSVLETRKLRMLDVERIIASRASILSHHWVATSSSIDCEISKSSDLNHWKETKSLFESKIDLELLVTLNANTVDDSSRAKYEFAVEVSALHLQLSKDRVEGLSRFIPTFQMLRREYAADSEAPKPLLPRLEVLSHFLVSYLNVHFESFRLLIVKDTESCEEVDVRGKEDQVKEVLRSFLLVASSFDQSFPHEEALASAMQLCIDRLTGVGLPIDDAWTIANSALLSYLEDVMERESGGKEFFPSSSYAIGGDGATTKRSDSVDLSVLESSVQHTVNAFNESIAGLNSPDFESFGYDYVADFPEGADASIVGSSYDSYFTLSVPSMFLSDGTGNHLLRVTAMEAEDDENGGESVHLQSLVSGQDSHSANVGGSSVTSIMRDRSISYQCFSMDCDHPFGSGGLPLQVLANDSSDTKSTTRQSERLHDVVIGCLEVLCSASILTDFASMISDTFGTLPNDPNSTPMEPSKHNKSQTAKVLLTSSSSSVLFASDKMMPFSRLTMENSRFRNDCQNKTSNRGGLMFNCQSILLANLTPGGELYSEMISSLSNGSASPICVDIVSSDSEEVISVTTSGLRVCFLQQYLSECNQYFFSENFGLMQGIRRLPVSKNRGEERSDAHPVPSKKKVLQCTMIDTSFLVPRNSTSSDVVAFETNVINISTSNLASSFKMPSETEDLQRCEASNQEAAPTDDTADIGKAQITRVCIELRGLEIFTALGVTDENYSGAKNAAFAFNYLFDGRAEENKPVFCPRQFSNVISDGKGFASTSEDDRLSRCWRAATANPVDLDILFDKAPHVRLLITEPDGLPLNSLDLDLQLSQFSLLLSLWFSNVQELPQEFPYAWSQLESIARPSYFGEAFPEFGTKEFQDAISKPALFRSEVCVKIRSFSIRCSIDSTYFRVKDNYLGGESHASIQVVFWNPVIHVANDVQGISRVGSGSSGVIFVDESKPFDAVLVVGNSEAHIIPTWADLTFGAKEDYDLLSSGLSQSFQFSVCMTSNWTLYNLGIQSGASNLADFSSLFRLLAFVSSYFSNPAFGNPAFDAIERTKRLKETLASANANRVNEMDGDGELFDLPGSNLDFRLWLVQPCLSIPCEPVFSETPGVRVLAGGLWYHYSSLKTFTTQEVVARNLSLFFDDRCVRAMTRDVDETAARQIVDGLSFALCLDYNYVTHHSSYSFQVPFEKVSSCSIISPKLSVQPPQLGREKICKPFRLPGRFLGKTVGDVTFIFEVMPLVATTVTNLFKTPQGKSRDTTSESEDVEAIDELDVQSESQNAAGSVVPSFSVTAKLSDLRFFAFDPVLGPHLPVGVISISSMVVMASQFSGWNDVRTDAQQQLPVISHASDDLNLVVEALFWADYFKLGQTRSWEPLLEPYQCCVLYEKSRTRGTGLSVASDVALHVNVSGALLVIVDEVIDSFRRLISQPLMGAGSDESGALEAHVVAETKQVVEESVNSINVLQELPAGLTSEDRVAFSIRNMTGQKIRLRKPESGSRAVKNKSHLISYMRHGQSTQLIFRPSISLIKNMSIADVDFPGLHTKSVIFDDRENIATHTIDLQVPGFRWLQDIKVDSFGRSFVNIVPRSSDVFTKAARDWRLDNALKLLVEVGLQNGGRQVTIKSLFSIVNRSSHTISVVLHPDPAFEPLSPFDSSSKDEKFHHSVEDSDIKPGEAFEVPTLLLESALRQPGNHLGSLWLRPESTKLADHSVMQPFYHDRKEAKEKISVQVSSRPIQLAKVVSETSVLFENNFGDDVSQHDAKTGLQVSCPVVLDSTERLSPFCYALEVARSPIVKAPPMEGSKERKHGPVAYTLSVHPTFVIANLLPEKGRFELMHAVHRNVVWFADLAPGQQVSVHSVGLDAPLLLLLNLGFCKTPVGEGALVHHGLDQSRGTVKAEGLAGLKSIGKAGKAVTKQLGKTLTKIGDSPDKRGHEKLFLVQNPQFFSKKTVEKDAKTKKISKIDLGLDTGVAGIENVGGKTYRTDTGVFFAHEVAVETAVVDSLGQRLTLSIENVRGGGGQRQISVFSPFWIVNTTEHALRFKQEKSKSFVSGTVSAPSKDGSLPLSGGRAHENDGDPQAQFGDTYESSQSMQMHTVFSGTAGALASSPGQCELPPAEVAALIESDLPIGKLANLAFMFNFNEGMLTLGHQKICVQLWDGNGVTRYASDWSQGFSLDSVGFSQVVSMHCREGRTIELTMVVTVAPGILSGYTKVVRFLPRYVVVNALSMPIRLWQDSSIFRPAASDNSVEVASKERRWRFPRDRSKNNLRKVNQYEALWGRQTVLDDRYSGPIALSTRAHPSALYVTTAGPSEIIPFNLPDTRGERLLRIDLGGDYNLTASISADVPGEHTLKVTKAVDLKLLPHVLTRASSEYEIRLTPLEVHRLSNELGIWFETEWGNERNIIVKAVKKESFAFNETDVHIGDELISVDDVPVIQMTFPETMNNIRNRMVELGENTTAGRPRANLRRASIRLVSSFSRSGISAASSETEMAPLVLRFRTIEDRLRRVRMKASRASDSRKSIMSITGRERTYSLATVAENETTAVHERSYIKAELRSLQHSLFLVVRDENSLPYRIENRSVASTIYYRQKGCSGHPWQLLKPGQSDVYAWEEPLRPKRLTVRVGTNSALTDKPGGAAATGDDKKSRLPFFGHVKDEEDSVFSAPVSVRLEEIGYKELLACPTGAGDDPQSMRLFELTVDVAGATRVLMIQDASADGDETQLMSHLESLRSLKSEEEYRQSRLKELNVELLQLPEDASSDSIVDSGQKLMADFPEDPMVTKRHQLVVTVMEANGLNPDTFAGSCNPYAEVYLKNGLRRRRDFFRSNVIQKTYYIKKTVSPTWNAQTFVFELPSQALESPRGHSLNIRIKNFRMFGNHKILGKALIDLHGLRDQKPLTGWFPLAGKTGRLEQSSSLSQWGRGSVRLSIQWIHSSVSLFSYFTYLSEKRLLDLNRSLQGLEEQLEKKKAAKNRNQEAIDGFERVRVQDLVSLSAFKRKPTRKRVLPMLPHDRQQNEYMKSPRPEPRAVNEKVAGHRDAVLSRRTLSPIKKTQILRSRDVKQRLEDMINEKRKGSQMALMSNVVDKDHTSPRPLIVGTNGSSETGEMVVTSFKYWSASTTVFQDSDLAVRILENGLSVHLSDSRPPKRSDLSKQFDKQNPIMAKLSLPAIAPSNMILYRMEEATALESSRFLFERATFRKAASVLHPGGWLMVRPHTALNLPESYTGMFVKLSFGSETLMSETVDAKVAPNWHSQSDTIFPDTDASDFEYGSNDMLFHIAPRKTSGSLRLSVMGEKSHPNLSSKAELGVLNLPLGPTLSACIDCSAEATSCSSPTPASGAYTRWFPLKDPKDVIPVEGDMGLSYRPPESEKINDNMFKEYFAPCIQLSLLWFPDTQNSADEGKDINHSIESSDSFESVVSGYSCASEQEGQTTHSQNESSVTTYFYADIGRISFALIDSQRAFELLSLSVSDVDLRYWTTRAKTRYGVSVGWLQVDQQDDNAREPVVLAPTPLDSIGPVIQALAVKDNFRSVTEVVSLDFIDVSIAEFDLTLEESILFDVFDFFNSVRLRRGFLVKAGQMVDTPVRRTKTGAETLFADEDDSVGHEIFSLLQSQCNASAGSGTDMKVYIEQLFLGVIKVNLSYLKGKKQAWELTSQGGFVEKKVRGSRAFKNVEVLVNSSSLFHGNSDALLSWAQHTSAEDFQTESKGKASFPQLIATLFPNVSDAPIRLQGKALNHIFEKPSEILQSVKKFYVNETLRQIYRIIGSLDFVGNPTMLFSSFVSGVRDLVLTPSQAFMRSPTDASGVGLGVAKGTLSLFSHFASGFFGFGAKVGAAAGQGMAWMTLDEEYRVWHRDKIVTEVTNLSREWKRRGVQSAQAMLARPVADVLFGVLFGVSGIFVAPVKGLRREGGLGLAKGLATGVIGAVIKPLVGVLDSLTHFSASIHDIAKSVNVLDKRRQPALKLRLPYTFGLMYILAPFDQTAARAGFLLKRYPLKKSMRKRLKFDEVQIHVEVLQNISGDTYMILTSCRVVVIKVKKDASGSIYTSLCWEISLAKGGVISSRLSEHGHNGIVLTLTLAKAKDKHSAEKTVSFELTEEADIDEKEAETGDAESQDALSDHVVDPEALYNQLGMTHFDVESGAGQFHGTGTGEKGEPLEWFTLLSEYENRAQLARFHNAICCLSGNFEAVIFDPSLGLATGSQGYTSFGMYHFAPTDPQQKPLHSAPSLFASVVLEDLPWIDEGTFCELKNKTQAEQKVHLTEQRHNFSFSKELESSKQEGGPDWLILARARALYDQDAAVLDTSRQEGEESDETQAEVLSPSGNQGGKSRFSKFKKWAASPLTTIPDYGILETGADILPFLRKKDRKKKSDLYHSTEDANQEVFISSTDSEHGADFEKSKIKSIAGVYRESLAGNPLKSWREEEQEDGEPFSSTRQLSISDDQATSMSLPLDAQQAPESILKTLRARTPSGGSDSNKRPQKQDEITTQSIASSANQEVQALQLTRIDRMERLIESLLILTSEQALRIPDIQTDLHQDLRKEVSKLRSELETQSSKSSASQEEIRALRREIMLLKEQILGERLPEGNTEPDGGMLLMSSFEAQSLSTSTHQQHHHLESAGNTPQYKIFQPEESVDDDQSEDLFISAHFDLPAASVDGDDISK